ncbi:TPA: hypothetical protein OCN25_001144 [Escherichia coli]|uniref:hypothetical protein n=1 Tax=Enterobacteriaceae TaxID=543 RepID=UPI0006A5B7FA|nr:MULTISPECIES: hypothetical protein [Enterobacteriaceae]EEW1800507.1 hypothetical protein [Escherichia coli]EFA1209408.1 hypothetical protein [Escherichia coli]EFB2761056.1 hypothetical protein [Escherichia coli]EFE8225126.1 hypothetical protein [Escherichia coli]EFN7884182.1 hypothetical protein [Escherichia coli]
MIEEKFVDFRFTLDENIPREIALEIVALRQVTMVLTAALPVDTRQQVIEILSKTNSPQIQDIVKNMKLIDA